MEAIPDRHRTEWPATERPIRTPSSYSDAIAAFGRTYRTHDTPLAIVDLYQAVLDYRGDYPDAKSSRVASALEVSRSTIRRWVDDDAVPYVVQGIQTVESREWLPVARDTPMMAVWARLVAWIFSSGAIHGQRFSPQWVVDDPEAETRLTRLLDQVGCRTREPDTPGTGLNGTVLSPTPDGSILGRVLAVLGAPVGAEKHGPGVQLPPWLAHATPAVRRAFARTYVQNRDRRAEAPHGSLREARSQSFRETVVALLTGVTGERVTVSGESEIYLSVNAMRALDLVEE